MTDLVARVAALAEEARDHNQEERERHKQEREQQWKDMQEREPGLARLLLELRRTFGPGQYTLTSWRLR